MLLARRLLLCLASLRWSGARFELWSQRDARGRAPGETHDPSTMSIMSYNGAAIIGTSSRARAFRRVSSYPPPASRQILDPDRVCPPRSVLLLDF